MTAKEYLSQAYHVNMRIKYKMEEIKLLRELATKASSMLSDLPKNKQNQHRMEAIMAEIIDLVQEIEDDMDRLINLKKDIIIAIKNLAKPEYQMILELRYLQLKKWSEISEIMGYGIDNIYKMHRSALKKLCYPKTVH